MGLNYNAHINLWEKRKLFLFGMHNSYIKRLFEQDLSKVESLAVAYPVKTDDVNLINRIVLKVKPETLVIGFAFDLPPENTKQLVEIMKQLYNENYFKEMYMWCNPKVKVSYKMIQSFQRILKPLKITIMVASIHYDNLLSVIFKLVLNSQTQHELIIQNEVPTISLFIAFQAIKPESDLSNIKSIQFSPFHYGCHPTVLEPLYKKGLSMHIYIAFDTNLLMRKSALGLLERYQKNNTYASDEVEEESFPILPSILDTFKSLKIPISIRMTNFLATPINFTINIRNTATLLDVMALAGHRSGFPLKANKVQAYYKNISVPWYSFQATFLGQGGLAEFQKI